jgi:large subunit ribosomal protein L21
MYAVIETGGKQYMVEEGIKIKVEKLEAVAGDTVELNRVLLVSKDDGVLVGAPLVEGAKVIATVMGQGKGPKIIVFRYKAKANYRRKKGHRQPFTELNITKIEC